MQENTPKPWEQTTAGTEQPVPDQNAVIENAVINRLKPRSSLKLKRWTAAILTCLAAAAIGTLVAVQKTKQAGPVQDPQLLQSIQTLQNQISALQKKADATDASLLEIRIKSQDLVNHVNDSSKETKEALQTQADEIEKTRTAVEKTLAMSKTGNDAQLLATLATLETAVKAAQTNSSAALAKAIWATRTADQAVAQLLKMQEQPQEKSILK